MNKAIRGAIAVAAAGALLLGGASSLAYWSSEAAISPASVDSGNLTMSLGTGAWTYVFPIAGTAYVPGTDKIVPGDVIQYKVAATVVGSGKTLKATLGADISKISATSSLSTWVTTTLKVDNVAITAAAPSIVVATPNASTTYAVTVTFDFDAKTATELLGQNGSINLSLLKLKLTQIQ